MISFYYSSLQQCDCGDLISNKEIVKEEEGEEQRERKKEKRREERSHNISL